ncbi:hypothetical protein ACFLZU_04490 [Thermodesulfobacteriota bacterium]
MKSKEIYRKIYEYVIWEIYGLRCSGDISSTDFYLEAKNNKLIYGVNDCGLYKFEDENLNDKYLKSGYSGKEILSYIEHERRRGVLSLMFARQELKKAMSTGSNFDIDDYLMAINTSGDSFGSAALLEGIEQIFRSKGETRLGYRDELLKEIFKTIIRGRKFRVEGPRKSRKHVHIEVLQEIMVENKRVNGKYPNLQDVLECLSENYSGDSNSLLAHHEDVDYEEKRVYFRNRSKSGVKFKTISNRIREIEKDLEKK